MVTDEEDAFESDFESTDEEAMLEDVDAAAEKVVREEERKTRRVCMLVFPAPWPSLTRISDSSIQAR